jgi:hypothetical protein
LLLFFITFMHSTYCNLLLFTVFTVIYCYLPETNIVSWVYNVAAILRLQNLVPVIFITIIIVEMFFY